jgi:hypothetical protein
MNNITICDICIFHNLPLQKKWQTFVYCNIEQGLGVLEGKYRKMTIDEEDFNFECIYKRIGLNENK